MSLALVLACVLLCRCAAAAAVDGRGYEFILRVRREIGDMPDVTPSESVYALDISERVVENYKKLVAVGVDHETARDEALRVARAKVLADRNAAM